MKYILTFLFLASFIACKKSAQHNEISKVEFARSGAWSDFGASISIDSTLNYKYYGDYGKVKQGYFVGRISRKIWDTLNRKLEGIKYKTLHISDSATTKDANYFELIIHWKNRKRHISRVWNYPMDSVLKVIKWIDTSYKNLSLRQVKDSIKFETTYHRPLPIPSIKVVEFPPPMKRK